MRILGKGASGLVHLVVDKETKEEFALKTMTLTYMSDKDKKSAELEVELNRVIGGPTIIKFYESFKVKENIFIVMDYAEGGSLA